MYIIRTKLSKYDEPNIWYIRLVLWLRFAFPVMSAQVVQIVDNQRIRRLLLVTIIGPVTTATVGRQPSHLFRRTIKVATNPNVIVFLLPPLQDCYRFCFL